MRIIVIAALALSGCATTGGRGRACDAAVVQRVIGSVATAELGTMALARSRSRVFRWVREGDVVATDYRADRLNLRVDARNFVTAATCG